MQNTTLTKDLKQAALLDDARRALVPGTPDSAVDENLATMSLASYARAHRGRPASNVVHSSAFTLSTGTDAPIDALKAVMGAIADAVAPLVTRTAGKKEAKRFRSQVKQAADTGPVLVYRNPDGQAYLGGPWSGAPDWSALSTNVKEEDGFGTILGGVAVCLRWPQAGEGARLGTTFIVSADDCGLALVETSTEIWQGVSPTIPDDWLDWLDKPGRPPYHTIDQAKGGPAQRLWSLCQERFRRVRPCVVLAQEPTDTWPEEDLAAAEAQFCGMVAVRPALSSDDAAEKALDQDKALALTTMAGNFAATPEHSYAILALDVSEMQTRCEEVDRAARKLDTAISKALTEEVAKATASLNERLETAKNEGFLKGYESAEKKADKKLKSAEKKVSAAERKAANADKLIREARAVAASAQERAKEAERAAETSGAEAQKLQEELSQLRSRDAEVEAKRRDAEESLALVDMEVADRDKEIRALKAKVASLETGLTPVQGATEMTLTQMVHIPRNLADLVDLAERAWPERLLFLESAKESAGAFCGRDLDRYWRSLSSLAEVLWPLHFGSSGANEPAVFKAATGIEYSPHESSTVSDHAKTRAERTFRHKAADVFMSRHLKVDQGGSAGDCCRIHFEFDDEDKKIVVGWVGKHLSNSLS